MSQQGDRFVERVLKGDPTPTTFADAVQYFRHRGGSGRAGAGLAGVSESSFRRWSRGTVPKPATQQRVMEAYRSLRSRPSKMGDAGVIVPVWSADRKRAGGRERDIDGGQLKLAPGTLAAAHEVWVRTGDADAALRRFIEGIGDAWYRAQLGRAAQRGTPVSGGTGGGGASGGGGGARAGGGYGGGDDDDDDEDGEGADEWDGDDFGGIDDLGDDYGMSIA